MTKPRRNRQLRTYLKPILPEMLMAEYEALVGGLFGDTLEDVVTFALISFVHNNAKHIHDFEKPPADQETP